jgi:hypothetical protein
LPAVFSRLGRVATAFAASAVLVTLAGCGEPHGLDRQEQVAFARACTSLVERNIVQADPPVRELSDERLDLDDPADFYSKLEELRGPDTFNFDDPADAQRSPKDKLDDPCRPKAPSRSSSSPGS